jgi:hypothetical protein
LIRPMQTIQEKFDSSLHESGSGPFVPWKCGKANHSRLLTDCSALPDESASVSRDANLVVKTKPGPRRIRRLALGFLQSPAGNIAIISALMMPVIVGFCGLVAETSYWYYRHRNVQDAADIAAYGAAVTLGRGGDDADIAAVAKADAIANGWRADSGTIEVKQDGPRVDVLLIENQPRYFTRFLCGTSTIPIGARAVAFGAKGGRARLVWVDEEPSSPGRLSTSCDARYRSARPALSKGQVQAVRAKTELVPSR